MNKNTKIVYRINSEDKIVFLNSAWEQFARANDGLAVISEKVLDQSLWNFISDQTTQYLYREILQLVRSNKSIVFNFRCDSPEHRRFMEMTVSPAEDEVQFEIKTLRIEEREPQSLRDANAPQPNKLVVICGWCKKINVGQSFWKEIEQAVAELGIFEKDKVPYLTHGICQNCFLEISHKINEKTRG